MLNDEQQIALDIAMSGKNMFITGNAGTGKSYLTRKIIEEFEKNDKAVIVCAPTGIAAINIGGATIHRVFNISSNTTSRSVPSLSEELLNADTIIIDEISMCRIDVFEHVAKAIEAIENSSKRYSRDRSKLNISNKLQLIVVGDFFQLPPVVTDKEKGSIMRTYNCSEGAFAFLSPKWRYFDFENIVLKTIVRQEEAETCNALNAIRIGDISGVQYFNLYSNRDNMEDTVMICGRNAEAARYNEAELKKLPGDEYCYNAIRRGIVADSDKLVDDKLILKEKARVILMANDDSYANGDTGEIVSLDKDSIIVELDRGGKVKVKRYKWEIRGYKTIQGKVHKCVIGIFEQYPIRLGYAITIHKSQGQTLKKANINPYSWACGQLYVALSRVESIEGIHLTQKINNSFVKVAPEVISFYNSII